MNSNLKSKVNFQVENLIRFHDYRLKFEVKLRQFHSICHNCLLIFLNSFLVHCSNNIIFSITIFFDKLQVVWNCSDLFHQESSFFSCVIKMHFSNSFQILPKVFVRFEIFTCHKILPLVIISVYSSFSIDIAGFLVGWVKTHQIILLVCTFHFI